MICYEKGGPARPLIIFDLDDTLIRTRSGGAHPKNGSDWRPRENVEPRLRELAAEHTLVVISNQGGMRFRPFIRKKIRDVFAWLCGFGFARVILFAVGAYNVYRKPCTTLLEYNLVPFFPEQEQLFVVGDAAGREGDHSDADRAFAWNAQMLFKHLGRRTRVLFATPEEYFDHQPLKPRIWCNPRYHYGAPRVPELEGERVFWVAGPPRLAALVAERIRDAGARTTNDPSRGTPAYPAGSASFLHQYEVFLAKCAAAVVATVSKPCAFPAEDILIPRKPLEIPEDVRGHPDALVVEFEDAEPDEDTRWLWRQRN